MTLPTSASPTAVTQRISPSAFIAAAANNAIVSRKPARSNRTTAAKMLASR